MEFIEVIKKRRSIRNYLPDEIPEDILHEILEAGRLAPSGGNSQNHFFGVIRDKVIKEELARAAGEQNWIATAPVVIAYCSYIGYDLADLPEDNFGLVVNKTRFGEEFVSNLNKYQNRKDMCTFWNNCNPLIPGQQIFLAAVNHGLNACWVGYLDVKKTSKILSLPEDVVCLFLMPIGYANEEPREITRKSLDEIVFYDSWVK